MPTDKKSLEGLKDHATITSGDLQYILEINKKAVEIYIEVVQQNEEIIETQNILKSKLEEIDRSIFRITVILTTIGTGTIVGGLIALVKFLLAHH